MSLTNIEVPRVTVTHFDKIAGCVDTPVHKYTCTFHIRISTLRHVAATHIEEGIHALLIQQSLSAPTEIKKADWLIQINSAKYHKFVSHIYPET